MFRAIRSRSWITWPILTSSSRSTGIPRRCRQPGTMSARCASVQDLAIPPDRVRLQSGRNLLNTPSIPTCGRLAGIRSARTAPLYLQQSGWRETLDFIVELFRRMGGSGLPAAGRRRQDPFTLVSSTSNNMLSMACSNAQECPDSTSHQPDFTSGRSGASGACARGRCRIVCQQGSGRAPARIPGSSRERKRM